MKNPDPSVRSVPALVDFCEREFGPRDAFRWRGGEEIQTVSYARFAREARALAAALAAQTQPGEKIAVLGENSYEWLVSWFAVMGAARVAVPLDPQLPSADLLALLRKSGASLLLCSANFEDVATAFSKAESFGRAVFMKDTPALLAPYEGGNWPCEAQPDGLGAIVYTSGTTGEPKGVMLSQWNFVSDALSGVRHMGADSHETLTMLPFYHTIGITPAILAPLAMGCTISLCKGAKYFKRDLETFSPQTMIIVPLIAQSMYQQVWDVAKKEGKDKLLRILLKISGFLRKLGIDLRRKLFKTVIDAFGGKLEWMFCGGAAVSPEVVTGFAGFGIDLLPVFGATECAPGISMNQRGVCKADSVGVAMDCNEIKLVDDEIWVKGDNVFMGYYENEQATLDSLTPDGWFKTGDLGRFDEDNYLYITGRIKNLIILSNGKNVSPEGLENKLMDIPFVAEALVYEQGGEIVAELFPDAEVPDAAARLEGEIMALNRNLPPYARIAKTVLRDTEFPKTSTKKIIRKR